MDFPDKLESTNCILCSGADLEAVFTAPSYLTSSDQEENFDLARCRKCDFVFVNPRPLQQEIGKYYPQTYGPHLRKKTESFSDKLKLTLQRLTLELYDSFPPKKNRSLIKEFFSKLIVYPLRGYNLLFPYKLGGKLLEVGCGVGGLLDLMRSYKWDTSGVEMNPAAAEYCQKELDLNVFAGDLMNAKYPDNSFDAIVYHHVLEHVYDPVAELREVNRILKKGGTLYIAVPNISSFEAKFFGPQWMALDLPIHLYHFSSGTLKKLLEQSGFHITRCLTYSPDHTLRLSIEAWVTKKLTHKQLLWSNTIRKISLAIFIFLIPFIPILDLLGSGSSIRMVGRK